MAQKTHPATWLAAAVAVLWMIGHFTDPKSNAAASPTGPVLEVTAMECYVRRGTFHIEGEVTNISSQPITASVISSYYGKDGRFISSDFGAVEYRPVLPGQSSPFTVVTPFANPRIDTCRIGFKTSWGERLNHIENLKH